MSAVTDIEGDGSSNRSEMSSLVVSNLSKTFSGMLALSSIDLSIAPGEIRVLVGENGSGKSTLIKILSGYHVPDPGAQVLIDGSPLEFGSPLSSYRLGCRFVHQDLGLVADRTICDNLFIGMGYPTRLGTIRTRIAMKEARAMLSQLDLNLDPSLKVSEIGASHRTGVAICRALCDNPDYPPRLLVMDEPTTSLPFEEVDHLISIVRAVAARDVAILFVTHHLDEVYRVGDSVTVLRDGRITCSSPLDSIDRPTLIERLVGKTIEDVRRRSSANVAESKCSALKIQNLASGSLRDFSLTASAGEVIGIAGITGSGREIVLPAIFGGVRREGGTIEVVDQVILPDRPDRAVAAGIGLLTADRSTTGCFMALSALSNLTLPYLRPFWSGFHLSKRKETAEGSSWFTQLGVRPANSLSKSLASFSGGNQQKILFAKWLRAKPMVFLLDEPTQGVDIGARAELHRQILAVAEQGTVVVMASTDIGELTSLCSRVLVLRHGRIASELVGDQLDSANLSRRVLGDDDGKLESCVHE